MKVNKVPIVSGLKTLCGTIRGLVAQGQREPRTITRIFPGNAQIIGAREEQQDAFGFSQINEEISLNHSGILAVLADGMGGLQMGREAAQLAVKTMLQEFAGLSEKVLLSGESTSHSVNESISQMLWDILAEANQVVYEAAQQKGLACKVGTTLIATVVHKNKLYWVSVGDSRIYLFRNRELSQLNIEHIYGRELDKQVLSGVIAWEAAQLNPEREALTSYVGLPELLEVDRNIKEFPLQAGDRVMLCSDGLYRALSIEEIKGELHQAPAEAAESLIQMVTEKGKAGQDNATLAILAFE